MARAASMFINDLSLLVGMPGRPARSEGYVPPVNGFHDLLDILSTPRAQDDPPYVLQVLKSYLKPRHWRPRARADLERELHVLASLFPEFAPEFRAIHKAFRLPLPASLLPVLSNGAAAGDTPPRRPTTLYCGFHYLHREPVVRVVSPAVEGEPPPPYASEDPDPDSTRLLAMRLAAEDEEEEEDEEEDEEEEDEEEDEADDSDEEVEDGMELSTPDTSETLHTPAVDVDDEDEDTTTTLEPSVEQERTISALSFHSLSFELDTALHPAFRFLFAANNEPENALADDDDAAEVESLYPPSVASFDSNFDEPSDVECCSMMATEDAD